MCADYLYHDNTNILSLSPLTVMNTVHPRAYFFVVSVVYVPFQRKMIVQDKLEKERNDAKNAVEEYVYDLRDKLCGIYEKYITEEVRKS